MALSDLQIPTQLDQSIAIAEAALADIFDAVEHLPPDRLFPVDAVLTPDQQESQNLWESIYAASLKPTQRQLNQERRRQRDKDFLATHSGHPRSSIASRIAKYGEDHPITICKRLYKKIDRCRQTLRKHLASPNPDPQKVAYYQQRLADLLHQRELNNEARRKLSRPEYQRTHAWLPKPQEPQPFTPKPIDYTGLDDFLAGNDDNHNPN